MDSMKTDITLDVLHSNILFAGSSAELDGLITFVDRWRSIFWPSGDVTLTNAPGCIGML